MVDMFKQLQDAQAKETLYRDNEVITLNQITEANSSLDAINTKERAELQQLEAPFEKIKDAYEKAQVEFQKAQEAFKRAQDTYNRSLDDFTNKTKRLQAGFHSDRMRISNVIKSKDSELRSIRSRLAAASESVRSMTRRMENSQNAANDNRKQDNLRRTG